LTHEFSGFLIGESSGQHQWARKESASGRHTSFRVWVLILNESSTKPDRIMRQL